jgi:hypothetical protein
VSFANESVNAPPDIGMVRFSSSTVTVALPTHGRENRAVVLAAVCAPAKT